MRIDINDPRLIDYALGELDDAETQAIREALELEENAAARAVVEEFGALAQLSTHALQQENESEQLNSEQRDTVLQQAEKGNVVPLEQPRKPFLRRLVWATGSLAACFAMVAIGLVLYQAVQSKNAAKEAQYTEKLMLAARQARGVEEPPLGKLAQVNARLLETESAAVSPPPVQEEIAHDSAVEMEEGATVAGASESDTWALSDEDAEKMPDLGGVSATAFIITDQSVSSSVPKMAKQQMPDLKGEGTATASAAAGSAPDTAKGKMSDLMTQIEDTVDKLEQEPSNKEAMKELLALKMERAKLLSPEERRKEHRDLASLIESSKSLPEGYGASVFRPHPFKVPEVEEKVDSDSCWDEMVTSSSYGEAYERITENDFERVVANPLSTFAVDVDRASYANVRRFVERGTPPPKNAVRIEELVNYFNYRYPAPKGVHPFSVSVEVGACPWEPTHQLAKIGLKGREIPREDRPAANFVFLLDVSGSMESSNKLPLVKESMKALLQALKPSDRIGIVTYASGSQVVLPSTSCDDRTRILDAIESLQAGGSTHGSAGIRDAYRMATERFISGGINRVILATDGDFNVGVTTPDELEKLIAEQAKSKVFLTALGFGMGNYKDTTLERLADRGNGNYAYIDSYTEARRTLVEQLEGTLITIAKDVKIQVEFNPGQVSAYRLIGYENRALEARDFNDDTKDAGEIGAGHTVTALYELVPVGQPVEPGVDTLKYQSALPEPKREPVDAAHSDELMTVKLRYKEPEGDRSSKLEVVVDETQMRGKNTSDDFRHAAAVAAFGMLLRDSQYKGNATWDSVQQWAESAKGSDPQRQEFIDLLVTTKTLPPAPPRELPVL